MLVNRNGIIPNIFEELLGDLAIEKPTNFRNIKPAVNIVEKKSCFLLSMAAPGLEKGDFNIDIQEDIMTISVKKESQKEVEIENKYALKEYNYNSFERSFDLPKDIIDAENIIANYTNGELVITLPKVEHVEPKPRLIEVK